MRVGACSLVPLFLATTSASAQDQDFSGPARAAFIKAMKEQYPKVVAALKADIDRAKAGAVNRSRKTPLVPTKPSQQIQYPSVESKAEFVSAAERRLSAVELDPTLLAPLLVTPLAADKPGRLDGVRVARIVGPSQLVVALPAMPKQTVMNAVVDADTTKFLAGQTVGIPGLFVATDTTMEGGAGRLFRLRQFALTPDELDDIRGKKAELKPKGK